MTDERRQAIEDVWAVLKNPLAMMSRPAREDALRLARAYELTVVELLEFVYELRRRA